MTNLEYYKDEFVYMLSDVDYQPPLCNYFEKIWTYSDCSCCPFCTKDNTVCDYQRFVDWLLAEHKKPIKLKQWEKDLLEEICYIDERFEESLFLTGMRKRGHFENVKDMSMKIIEILDNCEVED